MADNLNTPLPSTKGEQSENQNSSENQVLNKSLGATHMDNLTQTIENGNSANDKGLDNKAQSENERNSTQLLHRFDREKLLSEIDQLPDQFALYLVNGKKHGIGNDWNTAPRSKDYVKSQIRANSYVKGVGIITGELSEGLVAIDVDGKSAEPLLHEILGTTEIPKSVCWHSGKEGHYQILFQLDNETRHWLREYNFTKKDLDEVNGVKSKKYYDPETGEEIKKKSEHLEIRYTKHGSVLPPSYHLETGGYRWINSPQDTEIAKAPQKLSLYIRDLAYYGVEKDRAENLKNKKKLKTGDSNRLIVFRVRGKSAEPVLNKILEPTLDTFGKDEPLRKSVSWTVGEDDTYEIVFKVPKRKTRDFKFEHLTKHTLSSTNGMGTGSGRKTERGEWLEIKYNDCTCTLPPSGETDCEWINSPEETGILELDERECEAIWETLKGKVKKKKQKQKKSTNTGKSTPNIPTCPDEVPLPDLKSVPLLEAITQKQRDLVFEGCPEGTRNDEGGKLAYNLADTCDYLDSIGQPWEGDPEEILTDFFINNGYSEGEAEKWAAQKWKSCEGKGKGLDQEAEKWVLINVRNYIWKHVYKNQNMGKSTGKGVQGSNLPSYEINPKVSLESHVIKTIFGDDWVVMNDSFYQYSKELGAWKLIPERFVKSYIAKELEKFYKKYEEEDDFGNSTGKYIYVYKQGTYSNQKNCFNYALSLLTLKDEPANEHLIAFKNGTVDLRTGELHEHKRENYITNHIPLEYNPNVTELPKTFRDFVLTSYGEDKIELIRAVISWSLDPTAPAGKFVHLIGESGSGKGVFQRLLKVLRNHNQVKSMSDFSELTTPEGRHQYLNGVRLALAPDVAGFKKNLQAFYELVDNGSMSGRRLYGGEGYEKQWNVKFVMGSVNLLQIENAGDGWKRRCIPIPTKSGGVTSPDPDLEGKLHDERAEILSWALAMDRKERDNLLNTCHKTIEDIKALQNNQDIQSDSIKAFLDQCCYGDEYQVISSSKLFELYKAYCQASGYKSIKFPNFKNHVKSVLPPDKIIKTYTYKDPNDKDKHGKSKTKRMPEQYKGIGIHFEPVFTTNPDKSISCTGQFQEGGFQDIVYPSKAEPYQQTSDVVEVEPEPKAKTIFSQVVTSQAEAKPQPEPKSEVKPEPKPKTEPSQVKAKPQPEPELEKSQPETSQVEVKSETKPKTGEVQTKNKVKTKEELYKQLTPPGSDPDFKIYEVTDELSFREIMPYLNKPVSALFPDVELNIGDWVLFTSLGEAYPMYISSNGNFYLNKNLKVITTKPANIQTSVDLSDL